MDEELHQLCKEVYKRTGWETGEWTNNSGDYVSHASDLIEAGIHFPLYTSDYLLGKLPSTIKNEFDGDDDYLILYKKSGSWYADYMGQFLRCKGDTPQKALLKLTIALSEAGELK